jgi:RsiW-degrading membrane proteinase PrsW (M82 family)
MAMNKNNQQKKLFGLIDRENPFTWILAIIVAMLTIPLIVTLILYYGMR